MATNNIFSLLRLANLFAPPQNNETISGAPNSNPIPYAMSLSGGNQSNTPNFLNDLANRGASINDEQSTYNPDKDFLDLYKPRTAISGAYTQSLLNQPERTSPGTLRNIGAIIGTTLSNLKNPNPERALQTFEDVRFAPYNRAMEDWSTRNKALGLGAGEEDKANTNARLLAQEQVRANENEAKIAETERAHKASEKQKADTLEETKRKNDAYIWRQTHPNWQAAKTKGGTLVYVDPTNPQNTYDTGISLGTMTDQEMQNLITNRQMSEIAARGSIQENLQNERNQNQQSLQDKRAWSVATITDPDTGKQRSVRVNSLTGEIRELPKGTGVITKTGTGSKLGTSADGSITITTGPAGTSTRTNIKVAPNQRIRVHSADGKQTGTIEAREINLLPSGWTVSGVAK